MTMAHTTDAKTARVTAEKLLNTAPTQANALQHARLNEMEIALGELKARLARINAAGGVIDSNTAADLATLIGQL